MTANNNKITPRFRYLTDLLFYTERKDLDLAEFGELLNSCDSNSSNYFLTRFERAANISWENIKDYWFHRFCFIIALNNKKIKKGVYYLVEDRFKFFIERDFDLEINLSIIQYVQLCCARKYLGLPLDKEKEYLLCLSNFLVPERAVEVCELFIPIIWKNKKHLINNLISKFPALHHSDKLLAYLRDNNYSLNNKKLAKQVIDFCVRGKNDPESAKLFFNILGDDKVLDLFKTMYTEELRMKLYKKVESLGVSSLTYGTNGFNIIETVKYIDPELTDQLTELYVTYVYSRYCRHNSSNVDRIIKFIKTVDGVNPKIVLVCMTKLNKNKDIKKIIKAYPKLKKLSLFV